MAKQKKENNKKRYNALIEKKRNKEREQKILLKQKLKELNEKKRIADENANSGE